MRVAPSPPPTGPMNVLRPDCPSRVVMQRIGERWSMFVILALADGPLRFTALKTRVGVVTSKVLTETLRALETDGLISRQAHAESPPRVEYELTPLGTSLLEPIEAMRAWAERHVPEVLASRERHLDAFEAAVPANAAGGLLARERSPE